MADATFQTNFPIAVAERGPRYVEARDKILAADAAARAQASAALQAAAAPADWRAQLTAEILLGWLNDRAMFVKSDEYARGELPGPRPLPGFTVRHRAAAIAELGPAVLPRIVERLWKSAEYADEVQRGALFAALGMLRDRRAVMPMIALLEDPSAPPEVRGGAASALSAIGDPRGLPPLLKFASDPKADATARGIAIRSLGEFADPQASQALVELLKRDNLPLEDRRAAADGLRKRADPATRSAVFEVLRTHQDKLLRTSLIQTLGRVGTAADIPALNDVAAKSPELRERVGGAIEDIQARARAAPAKP